MCDMTFYQDAFLIGFTFNIKIYRPSRIRFYVKIIPFFVPAPEHQTVNFFYFPVSHMSILLCNEGLIKAEQWPCPPMDGRSQQMLHDDHVFHKHGGKESNTLFPRETLNSAENKLFI